MQLLTLSQMAEQLNVSAKTFSKHVKDKRIPHIVVGGRQRFDAAAVLNYLQAAELPDTRLAKLKPNKPATKAARSRFSELVGI